MDGKNHSVTARVWTTQSLTHNGDINVMFLAQISWTAGKNFNIERTIPFIKYLPQIRLQVRKLGFNAITYYRIIYLFYGDIQLVFLDS